MTGFIGELLGSLLTTVESENNRVRKTMMSDFLSMVEGAENLSADLRKLENTNILVCHAVWRGNKDKVNKKGEKIVWSLDFWMANKKAKEAFKYVVRTLMGLGEQLEFPALKAQFVKKAKKTKKESECIATFKIIYDELIKIDEGGERNQLNISSGLREDLENARQRIEVTKFKWTKKRR